MKKIKKNKRWNKNGRNIWGILIKLILFMAVVTTVYAISSNWGLKTSLETAVINQGKASAKEGTTINDKIKVPVICYHSINKDPSGKSPIIISPEKFREHLQTIKDNGYTTLTIAQVNDYLFNDKAIPEKSVLLTFDDGYKDNYTNAFPILKEFNMNATIFVISTYLDGDVYMSPENIKEMSDYGIDIESHTVTHSKLSTLSYDEQLKELKNSKEAIEKITGKPIISIAYPEGKYNEDTSKAVLDAGYAMGFTIDRGYVGKGDDATKLSRLCVDYTYKPRHIVKILNKTAK